MSPVTREPVYLFNIANGCLWIPQQLFFRSFVVPVPVCLKHVAGIKFRFLKHLKNNKMMRLKFEHIVLVLIFTEFILERISKISNTDWFIFYTAFQLFCWSGLWIRNTTWLSFCNHIKTSYFERQFLIGSIFIKLNKKQVFYVCTIFVILWQKETCTPFHIQNKIKNRFFFLSFYDTFCFPLEKKVGTRGKN